MLSVPTETQCAVTPPSSNLPSTLKFTAITHPQEVIAIADELI